MSNGKLIDRKELLQLFPALTGRGKNSRWRIDWLIRRRAIPIVKLGTRSIYFDEDQIREWIERNSIPPQIGDNSGK